jgi:hypothetical protein
MPAIAGVESPGNFQCFSTSPHFELSVGLHLVSWLSIQQEWALSFLGHPSLVLGFLPLDFFLFAGHLPLHFKASS